MHDATDMNALQERLGFIGIDEETKASLREIKETIGASVGKALDAFYAKARANAHTKAFFSDENHIAQAKARQEMHWGLIASAAFDANYVKGVSIVGHVHARLGLEPRWYIGGYSLIVESLVTSIIKERWPSRFGTRGSDKLAREVTSVVKAAFLDMDYGISVYLAAIEEKRRAAADAKEAADAAQRSALRAFAEAFAKLKEGDLVARLEAGLPGDFEAMARDYNDAVAALESVIGSVVGSVGSIRTGLQEINVASSDLSQRTEQQAASLEETVAALAEVTRGVDGTAASAAKAQGVAATAQKNAEKGGSIVAEAIEAMSQIEQSSDKIGKIIGVIDEIAFQTNLLALNAGVEAARAGEAGRGFAVVAQEVRGLAQRSAEAAKEIKDLISTSSAQVEQGVELVSASGRSLDEIVTGVADMARVVSEIARSAREQAVSLKEVSIAADQMDKVTQQNAAMVEETTAAAQSLSGETQELADLTERFRVGTPPRSRAAARTPAARRAPAAPAARPVPQMRTTGTGAAGGAARKAETQKDDWKEF